VLLDDALRALPLLERYEGPVIDVGSGGGSPGIPLAAALPEREVTLLDAERRKCDFLRRWAPPNARVVWGRAEEQPLEVWGVALAKALAQPPVAVEWCLPLVRIGGAAILWLGGRADIGRLTAVSARLGGAAPELRDGLAILSKDGPTPPGFPRRPGIAKKRPLA
jgi:16S rRNA (guanine527-N7)-methyltransferase